MPRKVHLFQGREQGPERDEVRRDGLCRFSIVATRKVEGGDSAVGNVQECQVRMVFREYEVFRIWACVRQRSQSQEVVGGIETLHIVEFKRGERGVVAIPVDGGFNAYSGV